MEDCWEIGFFGNMEGNIDIVFKVYICNLIWVLCGL